MKHSLRALVTPSVLVFAACADTGPTQSTSVSPLNQAADLDQCANGPLAVPAHCTGAAWQNGNLNLNQAHYLENQSIPYRMRFSNLDTGATSHVVRIEWDTTEYFSGQAYHALDYLTSYDRTESTDNDPCSGVTGCSPSVFTTWTIPQDQRVLAGPDGSIASALDNITQIAGSFTLFGGTITGVTAYTVAGDYSNTSQTSISITFTAQVADPVLAWGGHVSYRPDWKPQPTAANISGAPFHMRLLDLDGAGGNQDRSLAASAVYNLPNLIVIKNVVNAYGGTAVPGDFTMDVTATSPNPASFPGVTGDGTLVELQPGSYSVGEQGVTGYEGSYSTDCTGTIAYDQTKTCTVTNTQLDRCIGVTCDAPSGDCLQDGVCNSQTGLCEYAPKPSDTLCRASAGVCDVAEYCDGLTGSCPADGFAAATQECRASGGVCDPAEYCTGSTADCPSDAKSTAVCRVSAGICDVAESCDGVSNDCPADTFVAGGFTCRASAGICDVAETCTGSSAFCPADSFAPSSDICRASAGVCDVAETCTGSSASCPSDSFKPDTEVCRSSAGVCDVAETCTGSSASCPSDSFKASTEVCRASAGVCDVAETCTGSAADCPSDAFKPDTEVCRASAGVCDVAETCTGSAADCPTDAYKPSTEVCRASAGVCDVAETCTGSAVDCPTDAFAPSTEVCRAAAGVCDVAENCTGSTAGCPSDAFVTAGTECRASTSTCDPAEVCTGSTAGCPTDTYATCDLQGYKFYDANVNGVYDTEELGILGWKILLTGPTNETRFTDSGGGFDFTGLAAGDYTLCEGSSLAGSWLQTAPTSGCFAITVPYSGDYLDFGNVCLGAGGGKTLGFWTNKNGQLAFTNGDGGAGSLALLVGLNLRDGSGAAFDPTSYVQVKNWFNKALAVNMAYMLSAQLASMELAVHVGYVDPAHLVYAPGVPGASTLGFISVQALMDAANAELALHGYTPSGNPDRAYQETLKNALDKANNNQTFLEPTACAVDFGLAVSVTRAVTSTPALFTHESQ